eukprot:4813492-Pyramimonas_sp.AAC.2
MPVANTDDGSRKAKRHARDERQALQLGVCKPMWCLRRKEYSTVLGVQRVCSWHHCTSSIAGGWVSKL